MSKNNEKRRNAITKIILSQGEVRVLDLAQTLNVSAETIRSDLSFLEVKGILYRTHGGAALRSQESVPPMFIRMHENKEEKREIAYEAIHFIKDDSMIFIDCSSTALYLGRLLRLKKNLTIVTNSIQLIPYLAESKHKIIIVGGEYHEVEKGIADAYTLQMLQEFNFDTAIVGMDGCALYEGPAVIYSHFAAMLKTVLKRSKHAILMTDATKFNRTSFFKYADFTQFDVLITDTLKGIDSEKLGIDTIVETNKEK